MTALATAFNRQRKGNERIRSFQMKDNVKVWKGGLAVLDANGVVSAGTDAASITCVGVFEESVDNTLTGHTSGGKSVRVSSGAEYLFVATASQTLASVGVTALLVDDNTVQIAATSNSAKVGRITAYVDATHVWVEIPVAGVGSNP